MHVDFFLSQIKPFKEENDKEEFKKNLIIAGGCIVSLINKEHINDFDFLHCKVSYDYYEDKFYLPDESVKAILNKELISNYYNEKDTLIIGEYARIRKFIKRGWTLNCEKIKEKMLKFKEENCIEKEGFYFAEDLSENGYDFIYKYKPPVSTHSSWINDVTLVAHVIEQELFGIRNNAEETEDV